MNKDTYLRGVVPGNMSKENEPVCRQRFKGLENFLRRVAFNLGNTPSQTEVKIISCIPIDVSDLQQKITNLEKQLEEAKSVKAPTLSENKTAVNAAFCTSHRQNISHASARYNEIGRERATSPLEAGTRTAPVHKKSTVSFVDQRKEHDNYSTISNGSTASIQTSNHQCRPLMICEPQEKEPRKNFFKKRNRLLKKKKIKTQCVYYAQTTNTPFNLNAPNVLDDMEVNASGRVTQSYLAEMVEKQYKPQNLGHVISNISEYSSPICRDSMQSSSRPRIYESDACSCCYGPFHNIDNQRTNDMFVDSMAYSIDRGNSADTYYDSSLYDLVPVKEKPVKIFDDKATKKEPKTHMEAQYWPEQIQDNTYFRPCIVNYHTINPSGNNQLRKNTYYINKSDLNITRMSTKQKKELNFFEQMDVKSSKSCCIELGNIYKKKIHTKPKSIKIIRATKPVRKNAECLTIAINNIECQTNQEIKEYNEEKQIGGKTEATLDQIKTILQSVLTEVKTNNQLKNTSEEIAKKDAIVQNGVSQTDLRGSTFLNSFTYNPYIMNPYSTSCSHQINSNHFSYQQSAFKCLQNYPLLIQPGHQMCSNYFRHSPDIKPGNSKHANTNSIPTTNGVTKQRGNETEKLIKEIYKSMALNINIPTKVTSNSECETLKSKQKLPSLSEDKREGVKNNVVRHESEIFIKKKIRTKVSENSKFISNTASTQSQHVSTNTEEVNKDWAKNPKEQSRNFSVSTATEIRTPDEDQEFSSDTESETSSTVTDSDATFVPEEKPVIKKKEQKSLLTKVVNLFKKDKTHRKTKNAKSDGESETDSDDYQTIYSKKVERPSKNPRIQYITLPKRKTHSKISNSKQIYRREKSPRRSPYMEQEYRRQWNERLMFHDRKENKYSSERPVSRETDPERFRYYQHLEARSALVGPGEYNVPRDRLTATRQERERVKARVDPTLGPKGKAWLKKHNMGIRCGEQWKKLILEG